MRPSINISKSIIRCVAYPDPHRQEAGGTRQERNRFLEAKWKACEHHGDLHMEKPALSLLILNAMFQHTMVSARQQSRAGRGSNPTGEVCFVHQAITRLFTERPAGGTRGLYIVRVIEKSRKQWKGWSRGITAGAPEETVPRGHRKWHCRWPR